MATGTRRRRRPPSAAGFTLLEVLVAVAILALSLTSLLSSQMASLRSTEQARMLSTVSFLAEYQLVEIEWILKKEGGWGTADRTFEGDFGEQGWPSVTYACVADLIEMPEYSALQQAADAENDADGGGSGFVTYDAGERAFDTLGMVWPIVKQAIENSIRKSWCTVRWTNPDDKRRPQNNDTLCAEEEHQCLSIATFWTNATALTQLPALGGEADESDDSRDGQGGDDARGGGGGGGGGRGGEGGGGRGTVNPAIGPVPGGGKGMR